MDFIVAVVVSLVATFLICCFLNRGGVREPYGWASVSVKADYGALVLSVNGDLVQIVFSGSDEAIEFCGRHGFPIEYDDIPF